MNTQRSLRTHAARRNTLAACLAVALAAGGVGAADIADISATSRIAGTKTSPPARPAGNNLPVTNCLDDGSAGSLRQVIAGAIDGDVIDLSALTCSAITLQSGAIGVPASVSIKGPGQTELTIDGGGTDRVFLSKYDMTISDITISNGRADGDGGCVDVIGSDLILTRTRITGCHAGHVDATLSRGGGVYVGGNLLMEASTISASGTTANYYAYGGGIYVTGFAAIYQSTIDSNTATTTSHSARGGGLVAKTSAYIADSRFRQNVANSTDGTAYGGGLYALGIAGISRSTVSGNSVHSEADFSYGGGVHASGNVTLTAVSLVSNSSSSNCVDCYILGGGASAFGEIVANDSAITMNHVILGAVSNGRAAGGGLATAANGTDGRISLFNTTVSGNTAIGGDNGSGHGGGLAMTGGISFVAMNSTVAFNAASTAGGGIAGDYVGNFERTLHSCIVANNQAATAADLATVDSTPLTVDGSNNIVLDASANITLPDDTISVDPQLLPLDASNGGPTATHALALGSMAIDAGSNVLGTGYDQRGCPFVREFNGTADIGAFEFHAQAPDRVFAHGFDGTIPACP